VTCPLCRQKFTVVGHNIVDASRNQKLRELLLRGRLNLAVCPYCGAERQKIIGDLTNQLINSIPQEERKAYILQPKVFIWRLQKGKLNFRILVNAGGMPSSHSALVSAMATATGLWEGFSSTAFALSTMQLGSG